VQRVRRRGACWRVTDLAGADAALQEIHVRRDAPSSASTSTARRGSTLSRGWLAGADALYEALRSVWRGGRPAVPLRPLGRGAAARVVLATRAPRSPTRRLAEVHRTSSTGTGAARSASACCSTATAATARRSTGTPTCGGSTTRSSPCCTSGRPALAPAAEVEQPHAWPRGAAPRTTSSRRPATCS
jgi:hypothetical protein